MSVETPDDLRSWGYAPGFYCVKCVDCPPDMLLHDRSSATKRSWRCQEHAIAAWKAQLDNPPAAMTAPFDWDGLWNELFRMAYNNNGDAVADTLRIRIEAAFVPVEQVNALRTKMADMEMLAICSSDADHEATARAEAAEVRERAAMNDLQAHKDALAQVCEFICRKYGLR